MTIVEDSKIDISDKIDDLRKAAEIHKNVRKYAQTLIKPGMNALDFCNNLEEMNRKLHNYEGLNQGIGFPTGFSITLYLILALAKDLKNFIASFCLPSFFFSLKCLAPLTAR